jgi:hypothetical protein
MAHINSIGAGLFSDLSVARPAIDIDFATFNPTENLLKAEFATEIAANGTPAAKTFIRIKNVREFPAMGTPPNVVNVPVYGAATSQQIQGQADAPSMEITLNFVATDWASNTELGKMLGNSKQYLFRFALLNSQPVAYSSASGGLGTVPNTQYYWIGKIEAMQVTPQLTDANTATVTLTIQSEFFGAFTSDPQ